MAACHPIINANRMKYLARIMRARQIHERFRAF
jgi:hypothetical protein